MGTGGQRESLNRERGRVPLRVQIHIGQISEHLPEAIEQADGGESKHHCGRKEGTNINHPISEKKLLKKGTQGTGLGLTYSRYGWIIDTI